MAEELSIEETNKLRLKLGLPLLAVPQDLSSKRKPVVEKIPNAESKKTYVQPYQDSEEEDGALELSEKAIETVQDGDVLVLDDVNVLEDVESKPKRAPELVLPGTVKKSKEVEEYEKEKETERKRKRTFVAAMARSDESLTEVNETSKPIEGATLFKSDLYEEGLLEDPEKKKKKKKAKVESSKEQVKIIRRVINRGSVLLQPSDDNEEKLNVLIQPKAYGNPSSFLNDDEDEVDELELALRRSRKSKQMETLKETLLKVEDADLLVKEGELYTASNTFAQFGPSFASQTEGKTEKAASIETPASNTEKESLPSSSSSSNFPPPPSFDGSKSSVTEKRFRRGIGADLALLKESGALKKDEIVVGRANDAPPIKDLNKPGDQVILEHRDEFGRLLTPKEAYRQLKYQFRGDGPGTKKRKLREQQLQREAAARSGNEPPHPTPKDLLQNMKKDHLILWKN